MTLRGPAAHLRRAPGWRRSGDDFYWESLIPEGEVLPHASRTSRVPRPQSAIEGGQMDSWLQQLERLQSGHLRSQVHHQVPSFSDRTTSMPTINKEPTGPALRQQGIPYLFYSRDFSSSGSSSLCGSLLGSQESLQAGFSSAPERRGSWERARIMNTPGKAQAKLSSLAPVKTGWLPIQRKVMVTNACSQKQHSDQSASQVKLKQPITPTFQKNLARTNGFPNLDGEVEKSHTSAIALGVKTWQAPDQGSPSAEQVQERLSFSTKEEDRPLSWQALRRGWNINSTSPVSRGNQSHDLPTRTTSDPNRTPLITTNTEPFKHAPLHRATSNDPYRLHTPVHRTASVQPVGRTVHLNRTNSISHSPDTQTSSSMKTLVPQNKAGFSFITISSRKVSRSASLPASNMPTSSHSDQARASPLPPHANHSTEPSLVTLQKKATIVKVTEQRMTSSPAQGVKKTQSPPSDHASDMVVHRRKATIIKVTEHRESYSPTRAGSRMRHPEYRHSYTEGLFRENRTCHQGSMDASANSTHPGSPEQTNYTLSSNTSSSATLRNPEKSGGTVHRSMLHLFVNNPPAIAAPPPTDLSQKAIGERPNRPRRPLSCYGNVFGHTEPSKETMTQPAATRKWSFGLPQESSVNPVNPDRSFISPKSPVKETGQPVAESLKPNGDRRERLPSPQDAAKRPSPSLTLIKAPDPKSQQSPEEILALNAAAIIANIKLQRQLSKKKSVNGNSEKESTASPQGNIETDLGKCEKPSSNQRPAQHGANTAPHNRPHADFVPLRVHSDPERSAKTISLQEALERSRPDFISRSQDRVRELERKAQERREQAGCVDPQSDAALRHKRGCSSRSPSLTDNLFKPRDRAITGREMQFKSKRLNSMFPDTKKKKEDEKKRKVCLTNRQRAELFKKKLLDQILQRSND
ncbi:(E2-independent) E3 ubiquitin-conjugating enzyme FATS [Myripristis murdjan]|uniref:(E2-independent) E3 ubiquitin-conjugating enzyme FATS n=1 Tax=Myripristis murdjan TaxID=586833 RepID=UPI0011762D9A|nr:uncharacterized protein LOC115378163 [Myripristis murdjan]